MAILKIEPHSGVSGDMFLGALVSLSGTESQLKSLPDRLGLKGVEVEISSVKRCSISGTKVNVVNCQERYPDHSIDSIISLVNRSALSEQAKALSIKIFRALGEAEAAVHNIPIEKVHFHEVGSIDSIIDITGSAELLSLLEIEQTYSLPVGIGRGFVETSHGKLPIPAPATVSLLKGIPTFCRDLESELATPTGAAILKGLNPQFSLPTLISEKTAYGAGSKEFEHANLLRLSLVSISNKETSPPLIENEFLHEEQISLIQTNLDDMPGEILGIDLQDRLLNGGALDVSMTALIMKKGRPGVKLEVLCYNKEVEKLTCLILEETYSLGVRILPISRVILSRRTEEVKTLYGNILVKVALLPSGMERRIPEYEACLKASEEHGVSFHVVYRAALSDGND